MTAKENILKKLRKSLAGTTPLADDFDVDLVTRPWSYPSQAEKITQFQTMMESVHGQVYQTTKAQWPALLAFLLKDKKIQNLLYAPTTQWGQQLTAYWQKHQDLPLLKYYNQTIDDWKSELFFDIEASLTSTLGGIAATGSLIIWPNYEEPRLMNIIPPIHFTILAASQLFNNFYEAQQKLNWAENTPTQALLISGPSKTADIEQVLAYGAHGPKELIVLILTDQ